MGNLEWFSRIGLLIYLIAAAVTAIVVVVSYIKYLIDRYKYHKISKAFMIEFGFWRIHWDGRKHFPLAYWSLGLAGCVIVTVALGAAWPVFLYLVIKERFF